MTKPPIPAAENDPDPNIMVLVRALPRLRRLALCLTASSSAADLIVETLCRQVLDDDEAPGDDRHLFNRLLRVWRAAPLPSGSLPGPAIPPAPQPIRASLETAGTFLAACTDDERAALALVCVEGWTYETAAEALAIDTGQIACLLGRARARLAARLLPGQADKAPLDDAALVLIGRFVDGQADAPETSQIDDQLNENSHWRDWATRLRHATTAIRAVVNAPMGEPAPQALLDMMEEMRAHRQHAEARAARRLQVMEWGLFAAAGVAAAGAVIAHFFLGG